jgi:hypothetical protein
VWLRRGSFILVRLFVKSYLISCAVRFWVELEAQKWYLPRQMLSASRHKVEIETCILFSWPVEAKAWEGFKSFQALGQ